MTNVEFFNDPIAVAASMAPNGEFAPQQVTWQGQDYAVIGIGRQWETEEGRYVLVEVTNGDRFELCLNRKELRWYLTRAWRGAALI